MFDTSDEVALTQAVELIREVMDKHWQELNSQIIQRLNEATDDIVRASKMLREDPSV